MKTFIQPGITMSFTNGSGSTVASGEGVLLGSAGLFGVSSGTVLDGEDGEAVTQGVVKMAKTLANTPAQWAKAYWNNTAKEVTTTATSNTLIGVFAKAYGSSDTAAEVRLVPQIA